jgi:hypothetical protein
MEHTMSIHAHSAKSHDGRSLPSSSPSQKAGIALISVIVSVALLSSVAGLFEPARDDAAVARESVKPQPSVEGLAAEKAPPGVAAERPRELRSPRHQSASSAATRECRSND